MVTTITFLITVDVYLLESLFIASNQDMPGLLAYDPIRTCHVVDGRLDLRLLKVALINQEDAFVGDDRHGFGLVDEHVHNVALCVHSSNTLDAITFKNDRVLWYLPYKYEITKDRTTYQILVVCL